MTFTDTATTANDTTQTDTIQEEAKTVTPNYSGETYLYTAASLEIAAQNVRNGTDAKTKKRDITDDIIELAALIVAQGLLQNLIGFIPHAKKGKKSKIQIVAGGRRLTAICYAIAQGQLPQDYEIPVLIVPENEAIIISMTENSGRLEMSPANQFKAFKRMLDAGYSIEEISIRFGTDNLTIKRRLKLATIEPSIFAQYEAGETTLDAITPLTLTDDHELQLQVWNSLGKFQRQAHNVRRLLITNEINGSSDNVAKYIGIDAYLAAGGKLREDLFSDAKYISDVVLLESLAANKLKQDSAFLDNEGWAWIDYQTRINTIDLRAYETAPRQKVEMSEEQTQQRNVILAAQTEIENQIEAYEETGERDEDGDIDYSTEAYEALEEKQGKINQQLEDFDEALEIVHPTAKAFAGVIVTIDGNGTLSIRSGLINPDDKKKFKQAMQNTITSSTGENQGDDEGESGVHEKPKSEHSEKLTRQLTAHRTAGMQLLMSSNIDVALVTLAHKLAIEVFTDWQTPNRGTNLQMRLDVPKLEKEGESVKNSPALIEFMTKFDAWKALLPLGKKDGETLLTWLLSQEKTLILELLAFCTACTLNTIQNDDRTRIEHTEVAQALNLDMTKFWQPTRENYLAQIKKDRIIELVGELASTDVALSMATMQKNDLCQAAEKVLSGTGWLPKILITPSK